MQARSEENGCPQGLLSSFRVLDLTEEECMLCGKILGDLGADVVKIEKPGGSPSRNLGPFFQDIPDPEKSLFWLAYNTNKRGITLDIETADGREIFKALAKTADFVIESFHPGYMDALGLGYSALNGLNPRMIHTSITPFGQTGPYKDYKAPDLVCMAMGGFMFLTGDPDRPPVRISSPQAYLHAAAQAAVGTMIAHYDRESSGEGQHVDVAAQSAIIITMQNAVPFWFLNKEILRRVGPYRAGLTKVPQRQVWSCKDGFVSFNIIGGTLAAKMIPALLEWVESEGVEDGNIQELKRIEWATLDIPSASQRVFNLMSDVFGKFFLTRTKAELYEGAIKRHITLYPVASPKDHFGNAQLQYRDYWVKLEHPELGTTLTYPGAFCKASETPWSLRRRAPFMGEHNLEIYERELGFSRKELVALKQTGVI